MNASLWLAAALACAQLGSPADQTTVTTSRDARTRAESLPPPRPAVSRIVAVTVYQGQALVTREVSVPEGEGNVELIVTPLPPQTVDNSLYYRGRRRSARPQHAISHAALSRKTRARKCGRRKS